MNIGVRPTLLQATPQRRVEAHLLGFESELYGQELEVTFVDKLRDERKFGSPDDLRAQIAKDIEEAEKRF